MAVSSSNALIELLVDMLKYKFFKLIEIRLLMCSFYLIRVTSPALVMIRPVLHLAVAFQT
jgi:hypothetical protein